jgi:hypothetical protein
MRHPAVIGMLPSARAAAGPARRRRISACRRLVLVCVAVLAAGSAEAQCNLNDTVPLVPSITSLLPNSGRIYPPFYGRDGTITCTSATPCTLSDMTTPVFVSPQSPLPGYMDWYCSNLCGGLQGPVWWGGDWIDVGGWQLHPGRELVDRLLPQP